MLNRISKDFFEPLAADAAVGSNLKSLRRARGISQAHIAHILAVSQPTISRWERGIEEMPPCARRKLADALLNKKGVITPLIEMLVRQNDLVSVTTLAGQFVRVSTWLPSYFGFDKVDILGRRYDQVFDTTWRQPVCDGPWEAAENLLIDCEHDLICIDPDRTRSAIRIRSKQFILELDDGNIVRIGQASFSPATGEPPMRHRKLTIDDLKV